MQICMYECVDFFEKNNRFNVKPSGKVVLSPQDHKQGGIPKNSCHEGTYF